jgi:hypothetical protein
MNGWPPTLFKDEWVAEVFRCAICTHVYRDAAVTNCGHTFCQGCLTTQWDLMGNEACCSLCRYPLDDSRPNWSVRQSIRAQTVLCECKVWQGRLDAYGAHRQECMYATESCIACNQVVLVQESRVHRDSACPQRPVPCPECGDNVAWIDRDRHREHVCPYRTVTCELCAENMPHALLAPHEEYVCHVMVVCCPVDPAVCPQRPRSELAAHTAQDHTNLEMSLRREVELYRVIFVHLQRQGDLDANAHLVDVEVD